MRPLFCCYTRSWRPWHQAACAWRQPDRPRTAATRLRRRPPGFKSYGGCTRIGPLAPDLNCVVGPNGLGKSIIVRALRYGLGLLDCDARALVLLAPLPATATP
jgi:hypothetical protein